MSPPPFARTSRTGDSVLPELHSIFGLRGGSHEPQDLPDSPDKDPCGSCRECYEPLRPQDSSLTAAMREKPK